MKIDFTIVPDGERVTLTFHGETPATVEWNAIGVDMVLHALSEIRARMTPPIPDLRPQPTRVIEDPRWWIHPDVTGGSQFAIRHPGHGWLYFLIPRLEMRRLSEYLQKQSSIPLVDPDSGTH